MTPIAGHHRHAGPELFRVADSQVNTELLARRHCNGHSACRRPYVQSRSSPSAIHLRGSLRLQFQASVRRLGLQCSHSLPACSGSRYAPFLSLSLHNYTDVIMAAYYRVGYCHFVVGGNSGVRRDYHGGADLALGMSHPDNIHLGDSLPSHNAIFLRSGAIGRAFPGRTL